MYFIVEGFISTHSFMTLRNTEFHLMTTNKALYTVFVQEHIRSPLREAVDLKLLIYCHREN